MSLLVVDLVTALVVGMEMMHSSVTISSVCWIHQSPSLWELCQTVCHYHQVGHSLILLICPLALAMKATTQPAVVTGTMPSLGTKVLIVFLVMETMTLSWVEPMPTPSLAV